MSAQSLAKPMPKRWWQLRLFRCLFCLVLVLVAVGIALDQILISKWTKEILQKKLAANGFDLELKSLQWQRGFIAKGVKLRSLHADDSPILFAEKMEIRLRWQSLLSGTPQPSSLILHNANLGFSFDENQNENHNHNENDIENDIDNKNDSNNHSNNHNDFHDIHEDFSSRDFVLENIRASLDFPSPNHWRLESFQARCLGIPMEMQAEITNPLAFKTRFPKARSSWKNLLKKGMRLADAVKLDGESMLKITLRIDGAQLEKTSAALSLTCDSMRSPWINVKGIQLQTDLKKNERADLESHWTIHFDQLDHEETRLRNLHFAAVLVHENELDSIRFAKGTLHCAHAQHASFASKSIQIIGSSTLQNQQTRSFTSAIEMKINDLTWRECSITQTHIVSDWRHLCLDWKSFKGKGTASFQGFHSDFATLEQAKIKGMIAPAVSEIPPQTLGPFELLRHWELDFKLTSAGIGGEIIEAETLDFSGHWQAPHLKLNSIQSRLYDGMFDFDARLSADTRRLDLTGEFDFDIHKIEHLLTANSRSWLAQYEFEKAPEMNLSTRFTLPHWDDLQGDWLTKVKPKMNLSGDFKVGKAAFRGVPFEAASSSIRFTNMVWQLPDLHIRRPEGDLFLDYHCDAETQDYQWKIKTNFDCRALAPLLSSSQKNALALFSFDAPTRIEGELRGRWNAAELTRFKGQIAAKDFTFRGIGMQSLRANLAYVNRLWVATNFRATRADGFLNADLARFNSRTRLITLKNAQSSFDAVSLAKMIGPKIEQSFAPYRFASPPQIIFNGIIPLDKLGDADAQIQISGGPFAFWRFEVPAISAQINWLGKAIHIDDFRSQFYGGSLKGKMNIQLRSDSSADFNLEASAQNADLNALFKSVFSPESQSQGSLNGHLQIHSGKTADRQSWQGSGSVQLRQGLLWDVPLFGIFSPVLNTLSPGLGNSRAETGEATFRLDKGTITTSDLVIQEPTTRLLYQGQLDFDGRIDARVEAELLRDTPMVGKVVSLALWPVSKLFVYKVSGNLNEPIAEPIYVLPKFFMNPIDSIRNRDD